MNQQDKEAIRQYFKKLKPQKENKDIIEFLNYNNEKQKNIIFNFNINNLCIREYDLPFKKLEFINSISSFYYKGRVGRNLDLLLYYEDKLIGYIQYSSPIMNKQLNIFLTNKYGKYDFTFLNDKVVDVSVCIPVGDFRKLLAGKLLILTAMSEEIVSMFNNKYNCSIENIIVTSIFGKSSIYNRVRNLKYLGLTEGYHSTLTKEQVKEIYDKYKQHFPHRKIKKTAIASHIIRLYLHLLGKGISLSFEIKKMKKGVYICDKILPIQENLEYWYNRWFIPRRNRLYQ